jgi:hypothetical protein
MKRTGHWNKKEAWDSLHASEPSWTSGERFENAFACPNQAWWIFVNIILVLLLLWMFKESFFIKYHHITTDWVSLTWNAWDEKCFRFHVFVILGYLYIHNDIFWGWNIWLNMKFVCFINTLYAQAEENFIQYFSTTAFFMQPVSWSQVWNFPLMASCQCSKSCRFCSILDFGYQDEAYY